MYRFIIRKYRRTIRASRTRSTGHYSLVVMIRNSRSRSTGHYSLSVIIRTSGSSSIGHYSLLENIEGKLELAE